MPWSRQDWHCCRYSLYNRSLLGKNIKDSRKDVFSRRVFAELPVYLHKKDVSRQAFPSACGRAASLPCRGGGLCFPPPARRLRHGIRRSRASARPARALPAAPALTYFEMAQDKYGLYKDVENIFLLAQGRKINALRQLRERTRPKQKTTRLACRSQNGYT